jgi:[ribosomal protein S5]-alanine N-acetyltransferase
MTTQAMNPPESFETERLLLRRPEQADVPAMFQTASSREVARFMDWPLTTDIKQVAARNEQRPSLWDKGEEYYWVITLKPDMNVVGSIACHPDGHRAEFGFILNPNYWGNGYATEASKAIIRWLASEPSIFRIWATCDTENLASARVLEKAGLQREGTLRNWMIRPNISEAPRDAWVFSKVREG